MKTVVAFAAAILAAALVAGATPAATETFTFDVEFAAHHACTGEPVTGNTRVHMVITTTDNMDGSTRVRVLQQTHGQSLVGVVSGDEYNFNQGQDAVTEVDVFFGETGRATVRTEFIHRGEGVAFAETPGLDDLHERFVVIFTPLNPPTIESIRTECR